MARRKRKGQGSLVQQEFCRYVSVVLTRLVLANLSTERIRCIDQELIFAYENFLICLEYQDVWTPAVGMLSWHVWFSC
jgi:hypothetical protein